jgi:hypothetical protein
MLGRGCNGAGRGCDGAGRRPGPPGALPSAPVVYEFRSEEWVRAARAIRGEYEDRAPASPVALRMNLVVTDLPAGREGRVEAHVDTTAGEVDLELDLLDAPDVTVTVGYDVARDLFVAGDPQAAMAAFLGGRIKVDGDITKLLVLQAAPAEVDPVVPEVIGRLRRITA